MKIEKFVEKTMHCDQNSSSNFTENSTDVADTFTEASKTENYDVNKLVYQQRFVAISHAPDLLMGVRDMTYSRLLRFARKVSERGEELLLSAISTKARTEGLESVIDDLIAIRQKVVGDEMSSSIKKDKAQKLIRKIDHAIYRFSLELTPDLIAKKGHSYDYGNFLDFASMLAKRGHVESLRKVEKLIPSIAKSARWSESDIDRAYAYVVKTLMSTDIQKVTKEICEVKKDGDGTDIREYRDFVKAVRKIEQIVDRYLYKYRKTGNCTKRTIYHLGLRSLQKIFDTLPGFYASSVYNPIKVKQLIVKVVKELSRKIEKLSFCSYPEVEKTRTPYIYPNSPEDEQIPPLPGSTPPKVE